MFGLGVSTPSRLRRIIAQKRDCVFQAWVEQVTTEDLLNAKQAKRDRYGDEIDFDTYEKPLKQNMTTKVNEFKKTQT